MTNEYISTGFRDVDGAKNQGAYFDCLTLLDSLPHFIRYKKSAKCTSLMWMVA
jgi:hypothetical protein